MTVFWEVLQCPQGPSGSVILLARLSDNTLAYNSFLKESEAMSGYVLEIGFEPMFSTYLATGMQDISLHRYSSILQGKIFTLLPTTFEFYYIARK